MRALRSAAEPGGSLRDFSVGCDWYCADACSATRSAAHANGIEWLALMLSSIQLLQLLVNARSREGKVRAVARDDLLPFAAKDEAQELADLWIQRATWRLVDVDVRVAHQWIVAVCDVIG